MSNVLSGKASCMCGAVEMQVKDASPHVEACHCSMCRKWGGGPLLGMQCHQLDISGQEHVGVYDSSDWAQRSFCKQCGTHLYYGLKGKEHYFVPAGFFQELDSMVFDEEIFIEEKPKYYDFANDTKKLTAPEVYAKYSEG